MILPLPVPLVTPETRPFWEAAGAGRLLLKQCHACECVIWYPRATCPECWSSDTSWFEASGTGTIYSYTVNYRGEGEFASASPYVLAYVELAEGPRILTNVYVDDPSLVGIDSPVDVVFDRVDDAIALPRFRVRGPTG